jgi:hypothetical protein
MTPRILHLKPSDREPDLYASDIPWGRGGLSAAVLERGDAESYRELAQAAIDALATVTMQLERANLVIVMLRAELRARRAA